MIGEYLNMLSIFLSEGVVTTKGMVLIGVANKEYNQTSKQGHSFSFVFYCTALYFQNQVIEQLL